MARAIVYMLGLLVLTASLAQAEVAEVRLGKQFGLGHLPLIVIEQQKPIETTATATGLGDAKVPWLQQSGPVEHSEFGPPQLCANAACESLLTPEMTSAPPAMPLRMRRRDDPAPINRAISSNRFPSMLCSPAGIDRR